MQTFTFTPPLLPARASNTLAKKPPTATVEFRAESSDDDRHQIFVPASLEAGEDGELWRVTVPQVPRRHKNDRAVGAVRRKAILHLTRGELGKSLGTVELGCV